MTFIDKNVDKFLLTALILVFVGVTIATHGADWTVRTIDILTGALVGIITGKMLARAPDATPQDK